MSAKAALLQALIAGESFGLELIDRVKERTDGKVNLGQGSVYPALRDLEREGLVKSHEGPPKPERGGRPRRYYKITAEGRKAAFEDRRIMGALAAFSPVKAT